MSAPFLHTVARSAHPAYPARPPVDDDKVPFSTACPEYEPLAFTHKAVYANVGPEGYELPTVRPELKRLSLGASAQPGSDSIPAFRLRQPRHPRRQIWRRPI